MFRFVLIPKLRSNHFLDQSCPYFWINISTHLIIYCTCIILKIRAYSKRTFLQTEMITLSSKRMLCWMSSGLRKTEKLSKRGRWKLKGGGRGGVPLDFVRSVNLITIGESGKVMPTILQRVHQIFFPSVVPTKSS